MEKIIDVAKYISSRYFFEKKELIDEMKLNTIIFFIQKESFIRLENSMFNENFYGYKYYPLCKKIRRYFNKINSFKGNISLKNENLEIIDYVFDKLKDMDFYELSYLIHNEYSWIKSRIGIQKYDDGNVIISKDDILNDINRKQILGLFISNCSFLS